MSVWGIGSATSGSASVGTISAQFLAANPDRRYLRITNLGTASVYLALGTAAAVAGQGIALLAEAGGRTVEFSRESTLWDGAIQAVAPVNGVPMAYTEGQ